MIFNSFFSKTAKTVPRALNKLNQAQMVHRGIGPALVQGAVGAFAGFALSGGNPLGALAGFAGGALGAKFAPEGTSFIRDKMNKNKWFQEKFSVGQKWRIKQYTPQVINAGLKGGAIGLGIAALGVGGGMLKTFDSNFKRKSPYGQSFNGYGNQGY